MEEMSIEPLLWQLGAGWSIAAFVSALLLASLSEALLKLPKGAASLVFNDTCFKEVAFFL
jgi:hypothetical protein